MGFIQRKIFHVVVNLGVAVFVWYLPQDKLLPISVGVLILIFIGEMIRLKTRARKIVDETVGQMLKNQEKKSFTGVFWMAVASVVVSTFAAPAAISYAFAVLALADPTAALVGKYIPSHRFYKKKSYTGSAAFFFVALFTSLVFFFITGCTGDILLNGLIAAAVLTLVEIFSPPLDDNFTILVAASILFRCLI